MTHLELENLISEYLEGGLSAARQAEVAAHLASCKECRALVADVRDAITLCQAAEELEPASWLTSKILLATTGEHKSGWRERLAASLRLLVQPRLAYTVAMTIFSLSMLANVTGFNLRDLNRQDLNPIAWVYRANRSGHLLYARAEKFYYDLRVVYEIESRFRHLRAPADEQPAQEIRESAPPAGGAANHKQPSVRQLAFVRYPITEPVRSGGTGRSPSL